VGVSWPWGKKRAVKRKILWVDLETWGYSVHPSGTANSGRTMGWGCAHHHAQRRSSDRHRLDRAVTAWEQLAAPDAGL
jgi:hypothetical protein